MTRIRLAEIIVAMPEAISEEAIELTYEFEGLLDNLPWDERYGWEVALQEMQDRQTEWEDFVATDRE